MKTSFLDSVRNWKSDTIFKIMRPMADVVSYGIPFCAVWALPEWRSWQKKHLDFLPIWRAESIRREATDFYNRIVLRVGDHRELYCEVGIFDDPTQQFGLLQLSYAICAHNRGYITDQEVRSILKKPCMNAVILAMPWKKYMPQHMSNVDDLIAGSSDPNNYSKQSITQLETFENLYTTYRDQFIQEQHPALYIVDDPITYLRLVKGGILLSHEIAPLELGDPSFVL